MLDFLLLYELTVIILLGIECWLLWWYAKEHALLMDIIKHNVIQIKKVLNGEEKKPD